jgi:hydrogenase nickel incorporation protein HypA/HybF
MHETALMTNLLAIVERAARDGGGGRVRLVHARIGEFAGVNVEALRFAFEVLSPGTAARGGRLECEVVPLRVRCRGCGAEASPGDFVLACGRCGSTEIDIVGGREMEVDYILTDDEAAGDGAER